MCATASPTATGHHTQMLGFIADPARKILEHLEFDATGPPLPAARGAPPSVEPTPGYDEADPVYEE